MPVIFRNQVHFVPIADHVVGVVRDKVLLLNVGRPDNANGQFQGLAKKTHFHLDKFLRFKKTAALSIFFPC